MMLVFLPLVASGNGVIPLSSDSLRIRIFKQQTLDHLYVILLHSL